MTWPELAIQPPQNFGALDEAIENLFGYDWLILVSEDAARFFLERLIKQGHEVSELDSLRVCAIGETTAASLEKAHVHVDVIATNVVASAVIEQIACYIGGREALRRLNCVIPQASIGRDYLGHELQEADARADVIIAYQTAAASDTTRLFALQTLLLTDSVDAVAFASESDLSDLARLFDTNDLGRLLRSVAVFLSDKQAAKLATQMGVVSAQISETSSRQAMVEALLKRFSI
jgi:uroporphyrinogen III methyltransferase/synthase